MLPRYLGAVFVAVLVRGGARRCVAWGLGLPLVLVGRQDFHIYCVCHLERVLGAATALSAARRCHYRRCISALQCGTHAWHEPRTMRLLGWRDHRITKIQSGDANRRGSAGLVIIVAARLVGDGPFREAVYVARCRARCALRSPFEDIFSEDMERFLKSTRGLDIVNINLLGSLV